MQSCVEDACAEFRLYKDAGGGENATVNLGGGVLFARRLKMSAG